MPIERRNLTALGRKRRRDFDRSIQRLRDLGMPEWSVEYYRRAARIAGLPPHMVVCHLAVIAAGRQMQMYQPHLQMAERLLGGGAAPAQGQDESAAVGPSYASVQAQRQRISDLWREIQRHSAPSGTAGEHRTAATRNTDGSAPTTITRLRVGASTRQRTGTRSRRR